MNTQAPSAELNAGLIGYGEVGTILSRALREKGAAWVGAWDLLFRDRAEGAAMTRRAGESGVEACTSLGELLARADVVICAVTAANALDAAREAAKSIRPGTYFLDLNSASPATKAKAAKLIDAAGAHYVEAGVMTSVPPYGVRVPMLLGGLHAAALAEKLQPFGFDMKVVSESIGVASAIKMCRSILIKGLEAITVESMFTARRYGAEKQVLESLAATYPDMGWNGALPDYLISRVAEHGKRRAAEMREAAQAVADAGLEPLTALATAQRQDWLAQAIAEFSLAVPKGESFAWQELADAIAEATSPQEKSSAEAKR